MRNSQDGTEGWWTLILTACLVDESQPPRRVQNRHHIEVDAMTEQEVQKLLYPELVGHHLFKKLIMDHNFENVTYDEQEQEHTGKYIENVTLEQEQEQEQEQQQQEQHHQHPLFVLPPSP